MKKRELDEKDIKILECLKNENSQNKIAEKLGISKQAVSQRKFWMERKNIKEYYEIIKYIEEKNELINEKILERLKEGKSVKKIAEEIGTSEPTIYKKIRTMEMNGIKIPKKREIIERKILEGIEKGKNRKDIAADLGLSVESITRKKNEMKKEGKDIIIMKSRPANLSKEQSKRINELILKRLSEGWTQKQIAEELKVTPGAVWNRIRNMRKKGEKVPDSVIIREDNKNKIIEDAVRQGKDLNQIAKLVNLSEKTVSDRIREKKKHKLQEALKANREELVEKILKLKETKNATDEQLLMIAKNYGVESDVSEKLGILNESLNNNEER